MYAKGESLKRKRSKSQSAMEYLMTYGWSILIVAVVLGALSFLGVFNPLTFAPKASAGGCQVIRNTGLGVSNLEGACNNQVPQYVAQFDEKYNYVDLPYKQLSTMTTYTIVMWIQETTLSAGIYTYDINGEKLEFTPSGQIISYIYNGTSDSKAFSTTVVAGGQWYMVAQTVRYSSSTVTTSHSIWMNGQNQSTETFHGSVVTGATGSSIGSIWKQYSYFDGKIANVQIYNTSLTNSSIEILYQEGIGGVPIDLNNLVAWYPLNGNANDYSGNKYNGNLNNVTFTSDWYNRYTQP